MSRASECQRSCVCYLDLGDDLISFEEFGTWYTEASVLFLG